MGGTSIGGILALGLTSSKDGQNALLDSSGCVELFNTHSKTIFSKVKNKMDPLGLIVNKYDEKPLESVIQMITGTLLIFICR